MAKKNRPNKKQLEIMRTMGCRADTGLTDRCCDRIKEMVEANWGDLPHEEKLRIAGWIGVIVREESWELLTRYVALTDDR